MVEKSTNFNILWITTDQQRYDTINYLNNPYINTPNLDRLCQEGVAFTKAYCQSTVCTPSRASFLTGLYPSTIHVNRNGNEYFPDNVELITKTLSDIGYDCGLAGKLHIASAWTGKEKRTADGYKTFKYSHSPSQGFNKGNEYLKWLEKQGVNLDNIFKDKDKKREDSYKGGYQEDVTPSLRQASWCTEQAIEFISEKRDKPWLFSLNFFTPHPPYDGPGIYKQKYLDGELPEPLFHEKDLILQKKLKNAYHQTSNPQKINNSKDMIASYYANIELVDKQVGCLLNILEETGQRDNTIVIFMSDHGEMLGDHGLTQKGCRFYEGAVRVPLIISCPTELKSGKIYDNIVELTDLVPTIADITGLDISTNKGKKLAGKSLLPIFKKENTKESHREYVRCEYYDALNMHAPYNPEKHNPTYATMYFDGKYKIIVYHTLDTGELYDLEQDPDEYNNLWDCIETKDIKMDLLKKSFDSSIVFTDPGPLQIGRY
ncbi:MAG: sulfatase [Halanaerobiales bacterium]